MPDSPLILLVDDSEDDCNYFSQRLQICSPDLVMTRAATGHVALDLCQRQCFDCVVLEIALPDMSGFEVLTKLVPRVWDPDTAVVVITSIANRYLREAALKNGAQAAFYKPMTSGDMLHGAILKAMSVVQKDRKRPTSYAH
jgi:CheY-like chemotaxis protein